MCKRIFKIQTLIKQLLTKYQIFMILPQISHFHKYRNFQVFLQLFRPTASSLWISWQGHVRNTLFHFCQLPPVNGWNSNLHLNLTAHFAFISGRLLRQAWANHGSDAYWLSQIPVQKSLQHARSYQNAWRQWRRAEGYQRSSIALLRYRERCYR